MSEILNKKFGFVSAFVGQLGKLRCRWHRRFLICERCPIRGIGLYGKIRSSTSEVQFQRELILPLRIDGRSNIARQRVADVEVRQTQVGMIQQVERLRPEL